MSHYSLIILTDDDYESNDSMNCHQSNQNMLLKDELQKKLFGVSKMSLRRISKGFSLLVDSIRMKRLHDVKCIQKTSSTSVFEVSLRSEVKAFRFC